MAVLPVSHFHSIQASLVKKNSDWELVKSFGQLIADVKPEIVSMENVPRLKYHQVFDEFRTTLEDHNYKIHYEIVYGPDYGLPQERKRLILLASRLGDISLIRPTYSASNYKTVRDSIGNMTPLNAGETAPDDPLHTCSNLSHINLRRIRASEPGKTWKSWPQELRAKCHTEETGKGYVSVYGRMEWDKPSPTITTQFYGYGNGRFGHPEQNRALSLREGALLQTFPETYQFIDPDKPINLHNLGKHIGNAVPVLLGRVIAKSIRAHLETVKQME